MRKLETAMVLISVMLLAPVELQAATLNSDDYTDIAFNTTAKTFQSFGNGSGSFGTPTELQDKLGGSYASVKGMDFGNIYGAGRNDLVVGNGANVYLYQCESVGVYSNTAVTVSSLDAVDATIGDIDKDGKMDIAYTDGYWVYWAKNNGGGSFDSNKELWKPKQLGEADLDLGDLDGDGYIDIVVGLAGTGKTYWLKNVDDGIGGRTFTFQTEITGGGYGVALGDLNKDGKLDVMLGTAAKGYYTLGGGDGTFGTVTQFSNADIVDLASSDFNGDGYDDLVYADGDQVKYMINSGSANFFDDATSTQLSDEDSSSVATIVPEPATIALLLLGLPFALRRRK